MQKQRNRTGNQALVREINLSTIMNNLHQVAPVSRSTLAEMTGLNKTTVSSLIQELIDLHFVREIGLNSVGTGRPARLLELNPHAGCIISGEIGVDFISIICTNFATEIVWQCQESIPQDADQTIVLNHLLTLLQQAKEAIHNISDTSLGLAIGVPGLVDQKSGSLLFAPNLGWENVPLKTILRQSFNNLPIFVNNEANMAALGEYYFGAAQNHDEILYVSVGTGVGGGIVRNGNLVNGISGFAGEFGHMTINPDGDLCNCGNRGCWETQVSQPTLFRYIKQAIEQGQSSILSAMTHNNWEQLSTLLIVEAAQQDDTVALEALTQIGRDLGIGMASLVNILNPDLVIFGGVLSLAGEFLLPVINAELQKRTLKWSFNATALVLAQHGFDACVMGGVAIVYDAILNHPTIITTPQITSTVPEPIIAH